MMKKVLTIAGSDSGGGAGIQADLKTFSARGVFGMSAITALTAQNTIGVQGVFEVTPEFVGEQIDSVMTDMGADAWKTGMLLNAKIIQKVSDRASRYNVKLLVVDPVMVAKSGDPLLQSEAKDTLISKLVPLAYVITPNLHEAKVLTGIKIQHIEEAKETAIKIHELGAKNVVLKGGHFPDTEESIDILYNGKEFTIFQAPRINTKNTHGTGCTFASAIAAELAKGFDITKAVHIAKAYITKAIQRADELHIGKGHGPTNHLLGDVIEVDLNLINVKKI
ncbi:MAG: bifunctional hydroxymethylpyrimidine kinase/phosphomethylpyrimidine kinase [Candidatus Hodarchaeota archaeon]